MGVGPARVWGIMKGLPLYLHSQSGEDKVREITAPVPSPSPKRGAALLSALQRMFTGRVITQLVQLGGNLDVKIKYCRAVPLGPCTVCGAGGRPGSLR